MKISVIGLGKLGLCTAACFASKQHQVYGYDNNSDFLKQLKSGEVPIQETGLENLVKYSQKNLYYVDSIPAAVNNSDISLLIVPTPSESNGQFTNRYLIAVLTEIAHALRDKTKFHIVNIVSTVMPQSCKNIFIPMLEELSGKKCGKHFGLVYNPEFIALGSVIYNFMNPDMVLIGSSDEYSSSMVKELYRTTCDNEPQFSKMSLTSAEVTKLGLNCYVTMKISFTNELASLCELTQDTDIDKITDAIGADSRVGKKYLKAGLGFGGPCFPRDNIAFQAFAKDVGGTALLGEQVVNINNNVPQRLLDLITSKLSPASPAETTISLIGMSYKPQTHIIEESQSIMLANRLSQLGFRVNIYDETALDSCKEVLGDSVNYFPDLIECIKNTHAICLLVDEQAIKCQDWQHIMMSIAPESIVFDIWRELSLAKTDENRLFSLGSMNL